MDTKFNEQKAFEDLEAILNHMHAIANKFYNELQTAQNLNREKDKIIRDLKDEHAKAFENLKQAFEDELGSRNREIAELKGNLTEQSRSFEAHLQEYGDYNVRLTDRLQKLEGELNGRKRQLDGREESISRRERDLEEERAQLEREREAFDKEKSSTQAKLDAYEAFKNQAQNLDSERQEIHDSYRDKIKALEERYSEAEQVIEQLEEDKKNLEKQVKNITAQRDALDEENYRLRNPGM